MKPEKLNKIDFLTQIANYEANPAEWKYLGEKPALIDFYADWCSPCKQLSPILDQLAIEYDGKINIYKIDTETEFELASLFNVKSIPSLLFIPLGEQPQMANGLPSITELRTTIDKILLSNE